jgi:hypothetical protein
MDISGRTRTRYHRLPAALRSTVRRREQAKNTGRARPSCLVHAPPWQNGDSAVGDAFGRQAHGCRQCAWPSAPAVRRCAAPSLSPLFHSGVEHSHVGTKGRVSGVCGAQECAQGYEYRAGYARHEKQIEGQAMEPSEKKGVALPTRQACGPSPEGGNNYRRFPHGFPQEAWKTATPHVGRKHAERSMPRKRRVRRFSPAEGNPTFLFPANTLLCRKDNAGRLCAVLKNPWFY